LLARARARYNACTCSEVGRFTGWAACGDEQVEHHERIIGGEAGRETRRNAGWTRLFSCRS